MDITYLGHSSFKLKGKSASLVTDPFDPSMVGLKFSRVEADIVTVSHDHKDHNNVGAVDGVKKVISGPGEYEIAGVSIVGIRTFHDGKKGEERGKNTIYVIEMDGLRIAHLGDLGEKLKEKTIEEMGAIDILLVPTGGVYTIGTSQAVELMRAIEAPITIPMHYFAEGMDKKTFGELAKVDAFISEASIPVEKANKLSVKKAFLGEDQKIVILEKR